MGYIVVKNFSGGMDRRGNQLGGDPGTLWVGENVRINRRGDVERRKRWVSKYSLPAGTFGMHATGETLYAFGSAVAPTMPSGVTYQRLQHPDGTTAMSAVLFTENFDGQPYVIAEFADGEIYHYLGGTIVDDWHVGIVRDDMVNNAGIATHLGAAINASDNYSATVSGAVITVTGGDNTSFTTSTSVENGGATNDQAISTATTQIAVEGVSEVLATGTLTVTGGSSATAATGTLTLVSGGSGSVDTLTINGVSVISGAVAFNTSLSQTASDLASAVNTYASSPEYTATVSGAVVTLRAATSAGSTPNGYVVSATATTITTSAANMSGGAHKGVSSITVDGVEVLGAQVNYTGSNSLLAAAIATQIGSYSSSPEYTATVSGAVVTIKAAAGTGEGPNGFVVSATVDSGITVSAAVFAGGVTSAAGQPQINTFTIGGTFEAGDKFNIALGDESFGYVGNPTVRGRTALTFKTKLYSTASSLALFSGINDATVWNSDNVEVPGANFINMASQDAGSETLYGVGIYQGNLAFFARKAIQIWSVDTDESLNTFLQTVRNTGTRSPKSIQSFGNTDLFYYADSGVRSLRARDSTNAAFVSDVGTPIDPFVKDYANTLSAAVIEAAVSVLEPETDRYMLALGSRVFVFNYFPGAKISAWTYDDLTDDVGGQITAFSIIGNKLYARSGNTIFLYGGDAGTTYPGADEVVATVELPFLDGNTPGSPKPLEGFDAAVTGQWLVTILVNPANTGEFVTVGTVTEPTYGDGKITIDGGPSATHFAPKLVCSAAGAATITNLIIHYTGVVKGEEG